MVEDKLYTLDIPQRDGSVGYIGTFFTLYLKLATVLQSPEFSKEPIRVYYMSKFIISLIPGEEKREEIKKLLKTTKATTEEEYRKDRGYTATHQLSQQEKDHILITSTIDSLGCVSDFIDKHIGLSKKNKVGFIRMGDGKGKVKDEKNIEYETTE